MKLKRLPEKALFAALVSCFALWGLLNNMTDNLVPAFQKIFMTSQSTAGYVQISFYGAYSVIAIFASLLVQKAVLCRMGREPQAVADVAARQLCGAGHLFRRGICLLPCLPWRVAEPKASLTGLWYNMTSISIQEADST